MKNLHDMLPETLDGLDLETTGYHRRCYQEFTAHLDRLQVAPRKMHHSPRKNKSAAASPVKFPTDECIFCEKKEIRINRKTQRPTHNFRMKKESGWKKIESMAETLQNTRSSLYRKIKGVDLYAANAHYHEFCYRRFYRDYNNLNQRVKKKTEPETKRAHKAAAHSKAYTSVKELLKTEIQANKQLLPLSTVRDHYITELSAQGAPNPDYRSMKLKTKLEKDEELSEKN